MGEESTTPKDRLAMRQSPGANKRSIQLSIIKTLSLKTSFENPENLKSL